MPLTRPKAAQINFDVTNISDPLLRFNSGQTGTNDKDAGFIVERGDDTNVGVIWDESTDSFAVINTDETGSTSGDVTISSYADLTLKKITQSEQQYTTSNMMKFNQIYTGASSGSYFSQNEYQKIMTITPAGNSENYQVSGRIMAQSAGSIQTIHFNAALRSGDPLPDLSWSITYTDVHNGSAFFKPQLWTKETTTAGFIIAIQKISSSNLYGTVTVDIDVIPRTSAQKANVVMNTTQNSEQTTVDTGFTANDMTKVYEINSQNMTLSGTTTVSGNILPDANTTYDIGSSTMRFNDIYLAGNTVDIGGTKLSKDSNGDLDIKDSSDNRKTIKAAAIELFDTSGKKIKIERDATSGKMKSRKFDSSGNEETDSDDVIELSEDKSPKLGGNLDMNSNNITGTNVDIDIDGTGSVQVGNLRIQQNGYAVNEINTTSNGGSGKHIYVTTGSNGDFVVKNDSWMTGNTQFRCVYDAQVELYHNGGKKLETTTSGIDATSITVNSAFTFPTSDGSANQVLTTNGSGTLSWADQSGSGGGYTASATAPSSPSDGDEWWDTDNATFYKYINDGTTAQWVEWSPGSDGADASLDGTTAISGDILPDTDSTHDLGSSSKRLAEIHAVTLQGTSTSAQYADLAEMYAGDKNYEVGTVVCVGGDKEVTECDAYADSKLAGVVSDKPAYLMNRDIDAEYPICVGFVGRVPVKVVGHIEKGDLLTTSEIKGFATKFSQGSYNPGCIIGISLNDKKDPGEGTVEVLLKRS